MDSSRRTLLAHCIVRACLSALLLVPALHAAAQSREPIKIGAVLSLTGAGAGLGQPERSGMLSVASELPFSAENAVRELATVLMRMPNQATP